MKNLCLTALLLLITLCTWGQERTLDSIFTMLHRQYQFNGTVLIEEKGEVLYEKGYGLANETTKERNKANTIFELASCSKQFTAAAVVLLQRQGKLNYEDKLAQYIPELAFWKDVRIADLLHHTSGIPEFLNDMKAPEGKRKIWNNADLVQFYAARKDTLQFETRSRYRYSNTNYALLATIIERLSGMTYAGFIDANIFKPLKMTHTFVYNSRLQPRKIKHHATGYVWTVNSMDKTTIDSKDGASNPVYYLDGIVGTAKVNSTVGDLNKWITALKNNTFFTQEEFNAMTEITQTSAGKQVLYGFGLDVRKGEGKFSFGHTGSWDGYTTFTYHNQVKDRTIIILQNFSQGVVPFNNIMQVLDSTEITPEYPRKIKLSTEEMQQWAGIYKDQGDSAAKHLITFKEGHLFYNTNQAVWDMRFFPLAVNEFKGIRQGGADAIMRFSKDEAGKVQLELLQNGKVIGSGTKE